MEKMKRPELYSDDVLHRLVSKLAPSVCQVMKFTLDKVRADTTPALKYQNKSFEICKELEFYSSWVIDDELLDVFKNALLYRIESHDELTKEWVKTNNVISPARSGQIVTFNHPRTRNVQAVGTVISVHDDLAKLCVRSSDLGHVDSGVGVLGIIINYENVCAVSTCD